MPCPLGPRKSSDTRDLRVKSRRYAAVDDDLGSLEVWTLLPLF